MEFKIVSDALEKAIKSEYLKSTLNLLNKYFYNRKHESKIRDSILVCINETSSFKGFSEFPKTKKGAVDLSLFDKQNNFVAAIEFKHHYPKDLNLSVDRKKIISDITRSVEEKTTHFILIMQERKLVLDEISPPLKYMNRNDSDQEEYISRLEAEINFPKIYTKKP